MAAERPVKAEIDDDLKKQNPAYRMFNASVAKLDKAPDYESGDCGGSNPLRGMGCVGKRETCIGKRGTYNG